MRTDTAWDNLQAQARAREACLSDVDVAEWHIINAALAYVAGHPEWFADWAHWALETEALTDAAVKANESGDRVASLALHAAAELAHPENDRAGLFGGAS